MNLKSYFFFLSGILKKNSRGRAYLLYRRKDGSLKIFRLHYEKITLPESGQTVRIFGKIQGSIIEVLGYQVIRFPRRKNRLGHHMQKKSVA